MMAANRGRLKIAGVIWYSWWERPGPIWFFHTGLFTADLAPKTPNGRLAQVVPRRVDWNCPLLWESSPRASSPSPASVDLDCFRC